MCIRDRFYPKGFWANGECLTMDELSDARQGKNEAAARYMLAGGDAVSYTHLDVYKRQEHIHIQSHF